MLDPPPDQNVTQFGSAGRIAVLDGDGCHDQHSLDLLRVCAKDLLRCSMGLFEPPGK